MSGLPRLALRNLGRRPGRTALTALMIGLGTALACVSIGLTEGTYGGLIDVATRSNVGHFQITRASYADKARLSRTVTDPAAARAALAAAPAVQAVTPRVESGGLFALGNRTVAGLLMGVDPEREPTVSTIHRSVNAGAWLPAQVGEDDPLPVVLDQQLLRLLDAKLGSEVSFIGQGADGSMAAELFTVVGVSALGAGQPVAYVRLRDAQETLVLGERVHRLVGRVADVDHVHEALAGVTGLDPADRLRTWDQVIPQLARTIESDRSGGWIFLGIIIVVVLFGVSNTMLMSVLERTRELGVLAALGTRPRQLVALTLLEGLWLAGGAAALGALLGAGVNEWIAQVGIPLGDFSMDFGGVRIERMFSRHTLGTLVGVPVSVAVMAMVAAVTPARRVAKLSPTQALRD